MRRRAPVANPHIEPDQGIGFAFTCVRIQQLCELLRRDREACLDGQRMPEAIRLTRQMFSDAKAFSSFMAGGEYPELRQMFPEPTTSLQICFYILAHIDRIHAETTIPEFLEEVSRLESTLQILETDLDRSLISDEDLAILERFFHELGDYCRGCAMSAGCGWY